jgi:tripartite-type tricarboxylate transporter receptor subunit TctC
MRNALKVIALVGLVPSAVFAQEYPSRPIQLIIGFPPGGPTDIIGRAIGDSLSKQLNQPVVVINKGGASGTIAAGFVAKAKPDGYTLMIDVESVHTRAPAIYKTLPYDPIKDFAAVAKVAKQRVLLVVHPSVPVNTVKDLVALAKERLGHLNYSGTYAASSHIGGALFNLLNGVNMAFVPYSGGNQPITELVAGVVQVGFFTESTIAQHVNTGKLKALAVVAEERSTAFPELPTIKEAGAAPMDVSPWFGLVAPAGTPQPVIDRLSTTLQRIIEEKEFSQRLAGLGGVPIRGSTPESFTKEARAEIDYWKKFVADAKFPIAELP